MKGVGFVKRFICGFMALVMCICVVAFWRVWADEGVTYYDNLSGFTTQPMVAAGANHTIALRDDGTVWTWGANWGGQLGDSTAVHSSSYPKQVPNLYNVVAVAAGGHYTVALKSDGSVWDWGYALDAQYSGSRYTPKQVPNLYNIVAIAAGGHYMGWNNEGWHQTFALTSDGTVWAWGYNGNGQLGDGTTIRRTSPVKVPNLYNVIAIATGGGHTVALRDNGTVWAWGANWLGQLGDGTTTQSSTPVHVPNLYNVIAIAAGEGHTIALRRDGTVWAWGNNGNGRLGDGTTIARSYPVQAQLYDVVAIDAGHAHSIALRRDGTVWAWGNNGNGQLGDGTTMARSSPVQVPNLYNIVAVATRGGHNISIRRDGILWAWGANAWGQLGDGTATRSYMPTQVVGTDGVGYFKIIDNASEYILLPTPPPQFVPGDVNGDGVVTSADVALLRAYLAGFPLAINHEAADVNGDGQVTAADLTLLRAYLAGFPVTLGR